MTRARLRRHTSAMTFYAKALGAVKQGEALISAGKLDDALPCYLNARMSLHESHDSRGPVLTAVVEKCISWLERQLGISEPTSEPSTPPLAKTSPDEDLTAVFGFRRERDENAEVIRDVDDELLARKAGER